MAIFKKHDDDKLNPTEKYKGILYTTRRSGVSDDELIPARSSRRAKKKTNWFAELFSRLTTVRRKKTSSVRPVNQKEAAGVISAGTGRVLRSERYSGSSHGRAARFRDHFVRNTAAICIAIVVVSAIAIPTTFAKPAMEITLNDNGRVLEASTTATTVGDFLKDNEVKIGPEDVLEANLSDPVEEGMQILIRRAMSLTVKSNGQEITVNMLAGTVGEALEKAGVTPAPEDEVYPSTDTLVRSGMTIEHIIVTTQEATATQAIPFENTTKEDPKLEKGKTEIVQEGQEGELLITYKQLYKNGVMISQEKVSEQVTREPVNQVMAVGTYVEPEPTKTTKKTTTSSSSSNKGSSSSSSSNKGNSSSSGSSSGDSGNANLDGTSAITVQVTAYCSHCDSAGGSGKTASGTYPHYGTLGCNWLPFGTRVYIPGYGEGVVEDTGGMSGRVIDVYMGDQPDETVCNNWGRQTLTVYILN
ncbi:MAG: G5 domain-containing protein [Christensenella sp.]|nr:G5 domain-containing protein [Christensenella sp.]